MPYFTESLIEGFGTFCMVKAGLTAGTDTATIDSSALTYCIDNVVYSASALDEQAISGDNIATATTGRIYVMLDASGDVSFSTRQQRAVQISHDSAGLIETTYLWEDFEPTEDTVVVGYLEIANTSGSDFVPGTTATDAAGISTTFVDTVRFPG